MSRKSLWTRTSTTELQEPRKSEFDDWALIKRCSVDNIYRKTLHFRSSKYPSTASRTKQDNPTTVARRRRWADSVTFQTDSDGRSSALSNATDLTDMDNFFKNDFDYDAEDAAEPPLYPHLVHIPGTVSQELYINTCRRLRIPHSNYFYKHLNSEIIVLKRQRLGPLGFKACAVALTECWSVHTLDLTDNDLGRQGARYLAELIRENNFIKTLILTDNNLGEQGVQALAEVLVQTDCVETLGLSGNGLQGPRAEAVRPIIMETSSLTCLDLSNNNLADAGSIILGEAIALNDSLERLDLSWNQIRGRGAGKIAEAVGRNSSLKYLNVSGNGFYLTGCSVLANSLEKNSTLQELDISNNRIDKTCLVSLITGLRKNSKLKILRVGMNPLQSQDLIAIVDFLKQSPTSGLDHIDLGRLDVNQEFVEGVNDANETRHVSVTYGKIRRVGSGVMHEDESELLNAEPDVVFHELSDVLGVDVEKFLQAIQEDVKRQLDVQQTLTVLKVINNPLSDRCTCVLLRRLVRNGKLDIGQLETSREERKRLRERERKVKRPLDVEEADFTLDSEQRDAETVENIHAALYRVLARRIAGSSLYKQRMTDMRQLLVNVDVNGEEIIRKQVIDLLEQRNRDAHPGISA